MFIEINLPIDKTKTEHCNARKDVQVTTPSRNVTDISDAIKQQYCKWR